jgi:site-specific recombinase XerD
MKFLLEGSKGGPYSSSNVKKIVGKAALLVGIKKKVTPHTLRHSLGFGKQPVLIFIRNSRK